VVLGVLEDLVPGDGFQQAPQGAAVVELEFALGCAAEHGAQHRLHHVLGILAAAELGVHAPFGQLLQFVPVLAVQFLCARGGCPLNAPQKPLGRLRRRRLRIGHDVCLRQGKRAENRISL
jgi:hypothetical protein